MFEISVKNLTVKMKGCTLCPGEISTVRVDANSCEEAISTAVEKLIGAKTPSHIWTRWDRGESTHIREVLGSSAQPGVSNVYGRYAIMSAKWTGDGPAPIMEIL